MTVHCPASPDVDFAPHFTARTTPWSRESDELERAYRLRFEVYCIDCTYLDAADFAEPRETDVYDARSMHSCAYNLAGELVGYVRLVHHDPQSRFPWQLHCHDMLPGMIIPIDDRCAEVSRLMVRRDYRRRKTDLIGGVDTAADTVTDALGGDPGGERRRRSPQIMLSLYREMYQHSRSAGLRYWFAAMERPLARALQAMGFSFHRIGAEVDYFGPVAPYLTDLDQLEAVLAAKNPSLLAWMRSRPR